MAVLQPFVPIGNSGTVPDRFPGPPAGGWRIVTQRRYMGCFGPADAAKGDFYSVL